MFSTNRGISRTRDIFTPLITIIVIHLWHLLQAPSNINYRCTLVPDVGYLRSMFPAFLSCHYLWVCHNLWPVNQSQLANSSLSFTIMLTSYKNIAECQGASLWIWGLADPLLLHVAYPTPPNPTWEEARIAGGILMGNDILIGPSGYFYG